MGSIACPSPSPFDLIPMSEAFDWPQAVERICAWADAQRIELRDAVVLLPFAQLLPLLREAWARRGGWMPRIETTRTLAASLAPPIAPAPGQISFDAATDALVAARLLRTQSWARALASRDPASFDHAVAAVVELTQALLRAAAAIEPARRDAWWHSARELPDAGAGPGRLERLLARVALEWAAAAPEPASDALYALRPSAWIAVRAGAADRLADALLLHGVGPRLVLDTDVPPEAPFGRAIEAAHIEVELCEDFEDEAQRSAAQVLALLGAQQTPVALIALDRGLVRRVRALLERQGVSLLDETGWRLSTTRAGARVMALLRAMAPRASGDELLDWLKASAIDGPALHDRRSAGGALEAVLRRRGLTSVQALEPAAFEGRAAALLGEVQALREQFAAQRARTLYEWRDALRQLLDCSGDAAALEHDTAGLQALAALQLSDPAPPDGELWSEVARATRMSGDEFARWVDAVLEQSSFIAAAPHAPEVVITPLSRAMLRPFAAVVCPGADERRLGAAAAPVPLLGEAQAAALGLDTAATRRASELRAFAQLCRAPRLILLRRRLDGGEPLAPSPLLERLALASRRAGRPIATAADAREPRRIAPRPTARPLPRAAALLPERLSASAVEALRECPYRFFALRLLHLQEPEELDPAIGQRDYGTWLHAVLHRFHQSRARPDAFERELARLHDIAAEERAAQGLDEAGFLPYAASFEQFAPRYVEWLHDRDVEGARYRDGELELAARPAALGGTALVGRIDRIDEVRGAEGRALELIDYKTGSAARLKALVGDPAEDTQLAFYAALLSSQDAAAAPALRASYLALDSRSGIAQIGHADVMASARLLLEGLGRDLERLRAGAALPALGEGRACDWCAARGLCRRDDWAAAP
jgi:ATP-dependent helicase/nuclease subunit B